MKITEDVRNHAAGQGIAGEAALKQDMEAKSKEFVEKQPCGPVGVRVSPRLPRNWWPMPRSRC